MTSLLVAQAPTDSHGETNLVYVNSATPITSSYIKINDFVFRVQKDPLAPPGTICLNFVQRKIAHVTTTTGDKIDVVKGTTGLPSTDSMLLKVKMEVEHFSANKKGGTIDYASFVDYVHKQFENQFFTVGQQILAVHDSCKYIITIKEADMVSLQDQLTAVTESAKASVAAAASAAASAAGRDALVTAALTAAASSSAKKATAAPVSPTTLGGAREYGILCEKSLVLLTVPERCQIQLVNIPDKQQDEGRGEVVRNFNLEKLGIGGLKKEFGQVFRRAFASRIFPQSIVKKLGIRHVKGVLLYGPPGTGKTLIARKIGEILNCAPPKIVNGPEVFTKWVGGAEENIRKLFADAEAEYAAKGDMSQLHLVIFDEFDAICKQRGSTSDNTGVQDNVVNQLLSKIDGVNALNNVLLIGMTNRKDRIDEAVLRPGRFEVHVEIGLADEGGREEILRIHTRGMVDSKVLGADVNLAEIAHQTKNFSGAELEGLVRAAQSHAFTRHIDFENPTKVEHAETIAITMADFLQALKDIKPAFGQAADECKAVQRHGIIDYGATWQQLKRRVTDMVKQLKASRLSTMSLLIHGEVGSGKSSLAAFTAMASEFPYVKFVSAAPLVGYGELSKCNLLRKAFEDSYKSPLSVVVLDDLERLIELSQMGSRFSNALLQTLLVLIKAQPPEGKKLLVIATTSQRALLESLELNACFSAEIEAPLIPADALPLITRGLGAAWHSHKEEQLAQDCLPDKGMPITKLILMIEMATGGETDSASEDGPRRILTFERFSDARLQLGLS